jgi:hypothetical protein
VEGFATVLEIEYYRTERGLKPVEEFIDSLDIKMQTKIFRQISLLKEFGTQLGEPYSKQLVSQTILSGFYTFSFAAEKLS